MSTQQSRELERYAYRCGGDELIRRSRALVERASDDYRLALHRDFENNLRRWYHKHLNNEAPPAERPTHGEPNKQFTFVMQCYVCWNRIERGDECMLCEVCNPYKECVKCFQEKMKDDHPHPHFTSPKPAGAALAAATSSSSLPQSVSHENLTSQYYDTIFPEPRKGARNILSLDGGGIRGYLALLMFSKLCKMLMKNELNLKGEPSTAEFDAFVSKVVREKFTLITGTSIGGIVALLLGMETPLSEILDLFEKRSKDIFQKNWFFQMTSPKYSASGITKVCIEVIQNFLDRSPELKKRGITAKTLRMVDLPLRVAVTTFDLGKNEVQYFPASRENVTCLDAALSTSAAPTYFPIHNFKLEGREFACIDGAMYANDPRLAALLFEEMTLILRTDDVLDEHAASSYGKEVAAPKDALNNESNALRFSTEALPRSDRTVFHVLSVGTGRVNFYRGNSTIQAQNGVGWMLGTPSIIDLLLDASENMVTSMLPFLALTSSVTSAKLQVIMPEDISLDDISSLPLQRQIVDKDLKEETLNDAVDIMYSMGVPEKFPRTRHGL